MFPWKHDFRSKLNKKRTPLIEGLTNFLISMIIFIKQSYLENDETWSVFRFLIGECPPIFLKPFLKKLEEISSRVIYRWKAYYINFKLDLFVGWPFLLISIFYNILLQTIRNIDLVAWTPQKYVMFILGN